jgi:hypothetical protein
VIAILGVVLCLLLVSSASAQTAPRIEADRSFAPPTGISDFDFSPGTSVDAASGVAVDGARIYTVGETRIDSSDAAIGITARRLDGTLDPGFSEDGKLTISLAAGAQRDAGYGIAVLPGGLLRVLATTDVDAGTQAAQQNLDIAIVGLKPDGSFDETFGGGDGIVTFPAGAGNDVPARMGIDPATGRVAVTGCVIAGTSATSCGSGRDFFVAVRNADGSALGAAVPGGFDVNGVRTYNRAGSAVKPNTTTEVILNDRGIDVAWLPGGGLVSLIQVETNPDDVGNDWHAVVHAFRADGTDDPGFSGDGDLDLPIGDPHVIPGGLLVHGGRIWVTGAVRSGDNGEAFVTRVDPSGANLQFRAFDIRAAVPAELPVGSQGNDLMVVPGTPDTLVVGGFTTLQEGTSWAAAAFQDFEGDLNAWSSGETIFDLRSASGMDQQGTLTGLAVSPDGWLAAAGSLLDLNNADTSYGTARLLIDPPTSEPPAGEEPPPAGENPPSAEVPPLPPPGPIGVSIDAGAQYTNNRDVAISVVWPAGGWNLLLSNDGGFQNAITFPLAPQIAWRLDSSGPERLPKTVYVRFGASAQTFQDDIILDETQPRLKSVSVQGPASVSVAVAAATKNVRLRLNAVDRTSGVERMQIARSKSAPAKWRTFKKRTSFMGAKRPWVRVRDRAGNESRWVRAR